MKVIVEYDKYNTNIDKATIPLENEMSYVIELNETGDKVTFSTVNDLGDDLEDVLASLELTPSNVMEISRLLARVSQGTVKEL